MLRVEKKTASGGNLPVRRLEPFRKRSFCSSGTGGAKGEEELSEKQQEAQEKLLEGLELGQMQEAVNELLGEETFNIRESLAFVLKEGRLFSKEGVKEIGKAFLKSHLSVQKQMVVQILLLVLAASLFSNFANAFGKGQTGEVSFYVVYLLLLVLLYSYLWQYGRWNFQKPARVCPFYESTDSILFSGSHCRCRFCQRHGVLRNRAAGHLSGTGRAAEADSSGNHAYVLISMINFIHKEELLSRMAELFKTLLEWGLNGCTAFVIGMQVIQNMISPAVDSLKRDMLGKAAAAIPGVGNAIDGVTEVALGTAVLIRNSLGVLGMGRAAAVGAGSSGETWHFHPVI